MHPHMSPLHAEIITNKLLSRDPMTVFEWGSGGSTVYFTEILERANRDYEWITVETSMMWAQKVAKAVMGRNVFFKLYPYLDGDDGLYQDVIKMLPCAEYINAFRDNEWCAQVVIVDGRHRVKCVEKAKEVLDPTGTLFLHDAQRYEGVENGWNCKKHKDRRGTWLYEMWK